MLILINGHRAGTANVSKLSPANVERIEIVRGPSSVVYGSQNMGGVINIILKTGRTAPGNLVEGETGSWNLAQGKVQSGGEYKSFDWYADVDGGMQNNYQVGGGQPESNTAWSRMGAMAALGWQIDPENRIDVTARTDGIYNTGFRGSSANIFAFDNRYNDSIEFAYNGRTPDGRGNLFFQFYAVKDVDDLNNPSPLSNLNAVAARTTIDHNNRTLDIMGTRLQPRYKLWSSNELLVGFDWEKSWITSNRNRAGGLAVTQLSPQDNNEADNVYALYAEDSQNFLDDRLVVRGGFRQTFGTTSLLATPNAPTLVPGNNNYTATTYSAGATFRVTDWLNVRGGASSGFRAPTATELGSNFTVTPIGTTIFGNAALQPETSQQVEAGATFTWAGGRFDTALFQNIISNRISAVTLSATSAGVVVQQYQNNPSTIQVQGIGVPARGRRHQDIWHSGTADLELDRVRQRLLQLHDDRLWRRCLPPAPSRRRASTSTKCRSRRASGRPAPRYRGACSFSAFCAAPCGTTPRRLYRRFSSPARSATPRSTGRTRSGSGTCAARSSPTGA